MSWGYSNKNKSQENKLINNLINVFDNDQYKVYSSLDNLYYGNKISVRIINNKINKKIKVVLTGKDIKGENIIPLTKDVTNLKYLKYIKIEILNLLQEFTNVSRNKVEEVTQDIEKLNDKDFLNSLNEFFNNLNKINKDDRIQIWDRFYNDMFNRTYLLDNYDIILYHEKYLNLIGA